MIICSPVNVSTAITIPLSFSAFLLLSAHALWMLEHWRTMQIWHLIICNQRTTASTCHWWPSQSEPQVSKVLKSLCPNLQLWKLLLTVTVTSDTSSIHTWSLISLLLWLFVILLQLVLGTWLHPRFHWGTQRQGYYNIVSVKAQVLLLHYYHPLLLTSLPLVPNSALSNLPWSEVLQRLELYPLPHWCQ